MNGYLARLLARAGAPAPAVRPRLPSAFAGPTAIESATLAPALDGPPRVSMPTDATTPMPHPTPLAAPTSALRPPTEHMAHAHAVAPPALGVAERVAERVAVRADESDRAGVRATDLVPRESRLGAAHDAAEPNERPLAAPAAHAPAGVVPAPELRLMPDVARRDLDPDASARRAVERAAREAWGALEALEAHAARTGRASDARGARPTEIHVSIGRIEVTAEAAAPAPRRRGAERPAPPSLAEYLARRARGGGAP